MADKKDPKAEERLFTVPLRREWLKASRNRRAGRSLRTVRTFLVRHMKVPEKDIRVSSKLNDSIWVRGPAKPPAKVRIKASLDAEAGLLHASLPDEEPIKSEEKKKKKEPKPEEKPASTEGVPEGARPEPQEKPAEKPGPEETKTDGVPEGSKPETKEAEPRKKGSGEKPAKGAKE